MFFFGKPQTQPEKANQTTRTVKGFYVHTKFSAKGENWKIYKH